ncbi:MAG TPA: type IV toxin-antitoxin system AbiEi family antitoxin domain-containing protein [Dermatophilaceae bacterium]|nr:type IV toxin-antitoxin system AbiEi family antitoxin domain-containing protein [Dermatophilaceae bacterium]
MVRSFVATDGLLDLAAEQWGMFTTSQARQEGLSAQVLARLADNGYLERIRHGVYRIAGTPHGPAERLQAAWLALRPDLAAHARLVQDSVEAVVSHRSAAQLHQLGDLDADRLEFTASRRRQARDSDVRFHLAVVPRQDWTLVDGLPVTTPLRTITDLAQVRLDGGHLAGIVRDAVTTLHLDPDQVARGLRPFAHHYGAALGDGHAFLSDLLHLVGVPESTMTTAELMRSPEQQRMFDALVTAIATARIRPRDLQAALDQSGAATPEARDSSDVVVVARTMSGHAKVRPPQGDAEQHTDA